MTPPHDTLFLVVTDSCWKSDADLSDVQTRHLFSGKERASIVEKLSQEMPNRFRPPSPDSLEKRRSDGDSRDRRMAARRERDHRGHSHHHHHHHHQNEMPTPGSSDHSGMPGVPFPESGYVGGGHPSDERGFPNTPHTPHGGHFQDEFHRHHMPPPGYEHNQGPPPYGHGTGGRPHGYDMGGVHPDFHPDYDMPPEHYDQYDELGHHPPQHHENHGHFEQSFHRKERDRDRDRHRRDHKRDRRRDSGESERVERDHRRSRDGKERDHREYRDRENRHKEKSKEKSRDHTQQPPQQTKEKETFQPPPPQPIRIPHHREDSPVKEEEPRKLSLESRIASLLRTNSQDSDSSGMPFGSPDSTQPPLPQESPPPLPEDEAPPLPEPPADEPPPLPPDPDDDSSSGPPVVQWVGGGSQPMPPGTVDVILPDGSFVIHEDTPNSYHELGSQGTTPNVYLDEGNRGAPTTPAIENGSVHGTPQYQEVTVDIKARKRKSLGRKDSSDMEIDDDKMSLASNEDEPGNSQVCIWTAVSEIAGGGVSHLSDMSSIPEVALTISLVIQEGEVLLLIVELPGVIHSEISCIDLGADETPRDTIWQRYTGLHCWETLIPWLGLACKNNPDVKEETEMAVLACKLTWFHCFELWATNSQFASIHRDRAHGTRVHVVASLASETVSSCSSPPPPPQKNGSILWDIQWHSNKQDIICSQSMWWRIGILVQINSRYFASLSCIMKATILYQLRADGVWKAQSTVRYVTGGVDSSKC